MATPVALPIGVTPAEAVAYFERKGRALSPSFDWRDFSARQHAGAFTVAKSTGFDVLGDIHASMLKAIKEGRTFQQFADELTPVLQAKGWWGRREAVDPITGEARTVQLGSSRRLRTIFDTNMRTSYAAGRWEQIQRNAKLMPYIRYSAVLDNRTRPMHRAWHGTVLPVEHAWWNTHYPPCGWHCRCTVVPMTRRQGERAGVTDPAPSAPPRRWFNERSGEYEEVPAGIDPGFQFNVGKLAGELPPQAQAVTQLVEKAVGAPPALGAARFEGMNAAEQQALDQAFAVWATQALDPKFRGRQRFVMGGFSADEAAALVTTGVDLADASVSVMVPGLRHAARRGKAAKQAMAPADLLTLPALWRKRVALVRTRMGPNADQRVMAVIPSPGGERDRVILVEVNARLKDRAVAAKAFLGNRLVTAGMIPRSDLLNDKNYQLVWGRL